jgi:hypothetical protein
VLCDWCLSILAPYLYSLPPENTIKSGQHSNGANMVPRFWRYSLSVEFINTFVVYVSCEWPAMISLLIMMKLVSCVKCCNFCSEVLTTHFSRCQWRKPIGSYPKLVLANSQQHKLNILQWSCSFTKVGHKLQTDKVYVILQPAGFHETRPTEMSLYRWYVTPIQNQFNVELKNEKMLLCRIWGSHKGNYEFPLLWIVKLVRCCFLNPNLKRITMAMPLH